MIAIWESGNPAIPIKCCDPANGFHNNFDNVSIYQNLVKHNKNINTITKSLMKHTTLFNQYVFSI